jgi:hypothetical protein
VRQFDARADITLTCDSSNISRSIVEAVSRSSAITVPTLARRGSDRLLGTPRHD